MTERELTAGVLDGEVPAAPAVPDVVPVGAVRQDALADVDGPHGDTRVWHGSDERAPIPVFTPFAPILALLPRGAWSGVRPHGYAPSDQAGFGLARRWCGIGGTR